jgi:hypothetical protein
MAQRRVNRGGGGQSRNGDDGPTDADVEAFGEVTQRCPNCEAMIYDDVSICYKCGYAISGSARGRGGIPTWAKVVAGVLLVVVLVQFVLPHFMWIF